jgi:hypothetical protein
VQILAPIETASLGGSEEARREQVRERVRSALQPSLTGPASCVTPE